MYGITAPAPYVTPPQAPNTTVSIIIDVDTDMQGISRSLTYTNTTDANGNYTSQLASETYSKKGGGKVTITTEQIGGITLVTYEIRDKDGKVIQSGAVTSTTVIGLRGWGSGMGIPGSPIISGEKNIYNDMMIVIKPNGSINVFDNCNFEGTTAKGYYTKKDGTRVEVDGNYPSIRDDTYKLNAVRHSGYYALSLNNNAPIKIREKKNPHTGLTTAAGIHIHKGGLDWNYSWGCLTVFKDDWSDFISLFPVKATGTEVGVLVLVTI